MSCIYRTSIPWEGIYEDVYLHEKGWSDANHITQLLKDEAIDTFISSPYKRAMATIEELAQFVGKEIVVFEDLRELVFIGNDQIMADNELYPLVKKMFSEPDFSLPGGESIRICRNRAVKTLRTILDQYRGRKVVIGTHGAIMTLMMGYFDPQYDLEFLLTTSKPDIYRMEFQDDVYVKTERLWKDANLSTDPATKEKK
ncbi:histidine phosphatase family protein [Brevibacillus sp. 179-C 1.1 NHS]|uniref:histidine phosphatase family protein n=1 Tax=Brevibacillus sp. 179-C 1.1 NHS TaxID=3235177 RepID=UPI00399F7715